MTTIREEIISDTPVDLSNFLPSITPGYDWTWSWYEQDDAGAARDVTGWTAEMDLRETVNGPLLIKLSTANGHITNGGSTGKFTVTLHAADSAIISSHAVVTNVKVTDAGGSSNNRFKAVVPVEENITR